MNPTVTATTANRESMRIRLSDGRTLGFAEYGDPAGSPVLFFHGGTLSRLFGAAADPCASRHRVRLIAPDRPGIGISDAKPGRTLLDWAADVAELADRLDLARFAVVGHSIGGAFVLPCAYAMPKRLTAAAIVAGALPAGPKREQPALFRMPTRVQVFVLSSTIRLLMFGPRPLRDAMRKSDPPADRALFDDPEFTVMVQRAVHEGLRRGLDGVRADAAAVFAKAWGFGLRDIHMPVRIWYSDLDSAIPLAVGKRLAEALPQSISTFTSGQGHMSVLFDNLDEIFAALAEGTEAGLVP